MQHRRHHRLHVRERVCGVPEMRADGEDVQDPGLIQHVHGAGPERREHEDGAVIPELHVHRHHRPGHQPKDVPDLPWPAVEGLLHRSPTQVHRAGACEPVGLDALECLQLRPGHLLLRRVPELRPWRHHRDPQTMRQLVAPDRPARTSHRQAVPVLLILNNNAPHPSRVVPQRERSNWLVS
jgi:hypothetical protein